MGDAFVCDRCEEIYESGVHNGLRMSGLGLYSESSAELCHDCALKIGEEVGISITNKMRGE